MVELEDSRCTSNYYKHGKLQPDSDSEITNLNLTNYKERTTISHERSHRVLAATYITNYKLRAGKRMTDGASAGLH
jgi:hypothetical protein